MSAEDLGYVTDWGMPVTDRWTVLDEKTFMPKMVKSVLVSCCEENIEYEENYF